MIEGWKQVRFGDVVQFPPKIKMIKGKSYPFIPMENLNSGIKYVKPLIEKDLKGSGSKFEDGDTLFARITPCLQNGKIAQAKELKGKSGFGSTEYFVFRGKKDFTDTDFVYYLSKTHWFQQNAINSMVGSSGRQRADAGFVRSIKINLPPLKIQRKIASILTSYDDLIENNLKRIKLLEEQAQQTYEEWFVRFKFPGYENVAFDEESGLPDGWEKVALKKITTKIGDGLHGTPKYDNNGLYYFVNGNNLGNGKIIIKSETKRISENEFNKIKKVLNDRTILVAINGTLGNIGLYSGEKIALGKSACYINIAENVSKLYVRYVLESQHFQQYAYLFATGATIKNLGLKAVRNYKLNLPSISSKDNGQSILSQFDNIVEPNYLLIKNLQNQNQHLKDAHDILLPRLMSDIIDVDSLEVGDLKYNIE